MFSKAMLVAELVGSVPVAQASDTSLFGVGYFSDRSCTVPTADSSGLAKYEMQQVPGDQYCYAHKGYSIKLSCDKDDTVRVDHWLDVTSKTKPCTGPMMAGEPLMKDVPWEIAVGFLRGGCTWSSEHDTYVELTSALPENGYPTCDFTGASVRRLNSNNATANGSTPPSTPSPPTPTPPTPTPPTPTPASTPANASNATNATSPTPAPATPAPAPPGVASGGSGVKVGAAAIAGSAVALLASVIV